MMSNILDEVDLRNISISNDIHVVGEREWSWHRNLISRSSMLFLYLWNIR